MNSADAACSDAPIIPLCIDLNIWVRYLLTVKQGRPRTNSASVIVDAVQRGLSVAGPIQLVVSFTMLSRLEDVLNRLGFRPGDAAAFCSLVGAFARRGPQAAPPYLVLGGGVSPTKEARMPYYNPYDPLHLPARIDDEDGRVLDTAIAGRAQILATYNIDDFLTPNVQEHVPGRLLIYQTADHELSIVHANLVAIYLRTGQFSL